MSGDRFSSESEKALDRLIREFKRLPGIGTKSASRLAYYILRQSEDYAVTLARSIVAARQKLNMCSVCSNFSESALLLFLLS